MINLEAQVKQMMKRIYYLLDLAQPIIHINSTIQNRKRLETIKHKKNRGII